MYAQLLLAGSAGAIPRGDLFPFGTYLDWWAFHSYQLSSKAIECCLCRVQLLLAGSTAGAAELRCAALGELARCQALLGEARQRSTLQQAAALCRDAQGTAWG